VAEALGAILCLKVVVILCSGVFKRLEVARARLNRTQPLSARLLRTRETAGLAAAAVGEPPVVQALSVQAQPVRVLLAVQATTVHHTSGAEAEALELLAAMRPFLPPGTEEMA
jgi:hypothetical protein